MIALIGVEKRGAGSPPSRAHGGGWEGLGWDGEEPAAVTDTTFTIDGHGNRDALLLLNRKKITIISACVLERNE
jgi:hypothetical protein